ncbi:MAG TPA: hypothetical protein VGZ32_10630 [Actinocrinis sp.]|jgi:hypothetical protein|nr:hypothetical protein [Actinocrinis sp.]HEV3170787.1 hypothetical protein [Actinocrinis sp.]
MGQSDELLSRDTVFERDILTLSWPLGRFHLNVVGAEEDPL